MPKTHSDHSQHIFFDLDHTLWDYDRNANETLSELLVDFESEIGRVLPFDEFFPVYRRHNVFLWKQYREQQIDSTMVRTLRWRWTFDELDAPKGDWRAAMGRAYLDICPTKSYLMPNSVELLEQLQTSHQLHIITNGFAETQARKLKHSGLGEFFDVVVCPDDVEGVKKPERAIFDEALSRSGANRDSLYIGDNYACDVIGSRNAGMNAVFYNPKGKENPDGAVEIKDLMEILELV